MNQSKILHGTWGEVRITTSKTSKITASTSN